VSDSPRGAEREAAPPDERPPFGGRWLTLEAAVLLALAACIAALAWVTARFQ
jgi:hypothetical protein